MRRLIPIRAEKESVMDTQFRRDREEMAAIAAMDKRIEEHFGLNRRTLVITYDTINGDIMLNLVEGTSVEDVKQRLGFISRKFVVRYDVSQGGNAYSYDRGAIYPHQNFRDMKVFSVLATWDNVRGLYEFLKDRDDHRAARFLKRKFREAFPQTSILRRWLRAMQTRD